MKRLHQWPSVGLDDLSTVAGEVLASMREAGTAVLAIDGPMGAGKTTYVRTLAELLGVEDEVSSPTFGLINTYQGKAGERIHHMDWYRVTDEGELWDAGIPELLDSGDWCWVEWPERAEHLFPPNAMVLTIQPAPPAQSEEGRVVSLFSA